jgi:integrase
MYAYIVLCLLVGVRTEEARALRWDHLVAYLENEDQWRSVAEVGWEHERFAVYVWRSVRRHGETKTEKSRRSLGLPGLAVEALRNLQDSQAEERLAAGRLWADTGLVFTTVTGTALDSTNVRRMFRRICKTAGIGERWTPRELRHSFVSLLSASGVPIESIAQLVGHTSSRTTEVVYRHQIRPAIQTAAQAMDELFPTG